MGARYPNPRQVKIHRPYTVEELAAALGVHKHTVRRWIRQGLCPIDSGRPTVLRGHVVRAFLDGRRAKAKRPCAPGEIYCFKCRAPKTPAGKVADLEITQSSVGRLVAICETCGTMLYRRVNPTKIDADWGNLEIAIRQRQERIADPTEPKLTAAFQGSPST
jgi:plasmid maintenance system antidote protein VapI